MDSSVSKNVSNVVERFAKNQPASQSAIAFGLIKNIYKDAIEYKGITDGSRGVLTLIGLTCLSFMAFITFDLLPVIAEGMKEPLIFISSLIFIFSFGTFSIYFFLRCIRMELFRPYDEPIIFDRKNRRVYRIYRVVEPGWNGLLKSWPLASASYDWDRIEAEHHAVVTANTSTISRVHALVFNARKSRTDPAVVESFTIGNSMELGEVTVPAMYEHIRRFMEDGGPYLPPGESVSVSQKPATFLECMVRTGPYGDNLKKWWKNARFVTILGFLIFPVSFPIVTLLGIFSWLSYITSSPISWSSEVHAAVGLPTSD
ncbi:hypothetical protein NHH73_15250 [Oxalobacteraceae bacterium OTU3CINTB1]|nr:hypothetical protein NHH73_15250 [Oxalobacteraceae bacterium OTU3CINTB1]